MVNLSLNETLMRSVNTSLVVLLPILSLLLFGGDTLKDFAFALFVGVASGTYSSIFIAAPMLSLLKEREPRYQQIRTRAMRARPKPALRPVAAGARVSSAPPSGDGETKAPAQARPTSQGARSGAHKVRTGSSKSKKGKKRTAAAKRRRR